MDFALHTNYYVGLLLLGLTLVSLFILFVPTLLALVWLVSTGWRSLVHRRRWYRPSRRACRQVQVARKKHAELLVAYLELRKSRTWTHPPLVRALEEIQVGHFLEIDQLNCTARVKRFS